MFDNLSPKNCAEYPIRLPFYVRNRVSFLYLMTFLATSLDHRAINIQPHRCHVGLCENIEEFTTTTTNVQHRCMCFNQIQIAPLAITDERLRSSKHLFEV